MSNVCPDGITEPHYPHTPARDADIMPSCPGIDGPTLARIGPPRPRTSTPGTCHLVGCPTKGTVDHHVLGTTIGAPSEETWRRTSQGDARSHMICIGYDMVRRLHSFAEAIGRDPGVARTHAVEARILADYLRPRLEESLL